MCSTSFKCMPWLSLYRKYNVNDYHINMQYSYNSHVCRLTDENLFYAKNDTNFNTFHGISSLFIFLFCKLSRVTSCLCSVPVTYYYSLYLCLHVFFTNAFHVSEQIGYMPCHLIRITKMWLYFIYIYILNEYITMPYWNLYHVNIIQLRGLCVLTLRTPHYIIHSHVSTMIIYLYFACTSLMLMNILIQNTETFLRVILYLSQFYAF